MAADLTKAQRYEEAVKLDRAAMYLRNEMRRAHPRKSQVTLHTKRARRALNRLAGKRS